MTTSSSAMYPLGDGVSVWVGVGVGVSVWVDVTVGEAVKVAVSVGVRVNVSVGVGVSVGVSDGVGISVGGMAVLVSVGCERKVPPSGEQALMKKRLISIRKITVLNFRIFLSIVMINTSTVSKTKFITVWTQH